MENQKIQLDNQIMLNKHMTQEDVQVCVSPLNSEAIIIEKQIKLDICRAKNT